MRSNICAMVNKLQKSCWPENKPFGIDEVDFIGYHANSTTRYKRLEGMITIEYRHRVPLEHDLLVRLLLAMYIGNDIRPGEEGCDLKWCPVRNEMGATECTVTRVMARRTSRGHCRHDIPLGEHNRKLQRWSLQGKTRETMYLIKLATRGADSSLAILDKIRSGKWNSRPPNLR